MLTLCSGELESVGHGKHALAVAPEYVPAGHGWHVVSAVASVLLEYVPAGHGWQVAPLSPEYVPDRHGWHVVFTIAPVAPEYVPAGHGWHVVFTIAPVSPEYVPAGHGWQGADCQTLCVKTEPIAACDASLYVPALHG